MWIANLTERKVDKIKTITFRI